jgi:hypothetical protein
MAQINLLKQSSTGGDLEKNVPKFLIWVFLVVLVLLLSYYGWLFFESKSIDNKIAAAQTQIQSDSQTALADKGRGELLTRQQQLQSLSGLIAAHIYWSQLFKPLADATLKNASYSSLTVGTDNDLTLSVTVPTLQDMDKFMQVFNLPEFDQNFSDIRIGGFTKSQDKNSTSIKFEVKMQYNPKIIQYQSPSNNAG